MIGVIARNWGYWPMGTLVTIIPSMIPVYVYIMRHDWKEMVNPRGEVGIFFTHKIGVGECDVKIFQ